MYCILNTSLFSKITFYFFKYESKVNKLHVNIFNIKFIILKYIRVIKISVECFLNVRLFLVTLDLTEILYSVTFYSI